MILAMFPITVVASACIAVLARYIGVHVDTLVAVAALRKEFALFARVYILTLFICFIALRPVFTAYEDFFGLLGSC